MNTEELINVLSADARPARPQRLTVSIALVGAAALGVCVLLVLVVNGLRPEFGAHAMAVFLKASFSALFAAVALPVASRLAQPGRSAGAWAGVTFVIGLATIVLGGLWMMPGDATSRQAAQGFPWAFLIIPALAAPAGFFIFSWYRRFAPTRLALAGASVGAMSGGLGAMAYALVCPVDDMGFVSLWYGAAILVCAAVGALVGPRVLKW